MNCLRLARYYWNHAQFCRKHGFINEAEIFENDSWNLLIEHFSGIKP